MQNRVEDEHLIGVEKRTIKWFLALFYIISIAFDVFSDYIFPKLANQLNDDSPNFLGFWIYLILFGLIPVAVYLYRNNKQYYIKYLYFISYTLLTMVNDSISYFNSPEPYKSGNIVEMFWLLLSPIFVSNRFVQLVSIGLIAKYIVVGLIIQSANVIYAILLVILLSILSFIILSRFQSYVNGVKASYDQQLVGIVKGVIATLELKDPYTRGHSERVAGYASVLAKETGKFKAEELRNFSFSCLLHDIGKINIPDHILMKPTSLTNEEYEIIKSHTIVGAEAVSKVVGLDNSIEVIRSHHERWDGKGYPDQLKGEEIPFLARIAAIADAFDAMTSTRSYRQALTVEEAYKRILEGSGTQFDPVLVELFKDVFHSWITIHDQWSVKRENNIIDLNQLVELKEVKI